MAGIRVEGNTSGNVAEVTTNNELKVALGTTPATMGGARIFSENDAGDILGTPHLKSPETSQDYRIRCGEDTLLFQDHFNATAQNTGLWKHAFATMTMTQSAGNLNVNAAGTSTVSGNYAYLQSWRYLPLWASAPMCMEIVAQYDRVAVANEVIQFGFGVPTGAADPVDGVWIELTSGGLRGCARFNSGTVSKVGLEAAGATATNTTFKYFIIVGTREIEFWINDVLYGSIATSAVQGTPMIGISLPVFIQKYNASTVGTSPNVITKVAYVSVTLMDFSISKPWGYQMAGTGLHGYQGQNGGTMGGLATWPNSTNPTTAAPSNTALTANLPGGLGGQGLATLWNVAATDMIMNSYQNPAGGVNQTPRTLYITGIRIDAAVFTAALTAPAAGTHLFQWGLAFGHTAVALNTAETGSFVTATAKAPRRKALGLMAITTGTAAIGTPANQPVQVKFNTPVVVNPGEFVAVVCKMLNGAATASGGLYFVIDFDAYYE